MAFKISAVSKTAKSDQPKVDYEAMNQMIVDTADLKERTTLVGYIAGIVDLGEQEQEDAEYPYDGKAEDEAKEIEARPETYFKDGISEQTKKPVRLKCFPQKPIQSVAFAVDFPDIIVDKGQFFGTSNPQPLRLWMGGQFYIQNVGMVIGRPTPLRVTKLENGQWSFARNHLCHKLAVAAKLVKPDEAFLPQDIDQLLGKAFQFEAQVYMKETKGKSYYTEYLKFQGALGRGQASPEPVAEPFLLQFDDENNTEALGNLRSHVINTIKRAQNFEGSAIQKQLEERQSKPESKEETPKETKTPVTSTPKVKVVPEDDETSPF